MVFQSPFTPAAPERSEARGTHSPVSTRVTSFWALLPIKLAAVIGCTSKWSQRMPMVAVLQMWSNDGGNSNDEFG